MARVDIRKNAEVLGDKFSEEFDINKALFNLRESCMQLKRAVSKLPKSVIKQYLLLEIVKPTKLKVFADFDRLHNKVSNIAQIIVMEKLENVSDVKAVLRLLDGIKDKLKKIIDYKKDMSGY